MREVIAENTRLREQIDDLKAELAYYKSENEIGADADWQVWLAAKLVTRRSIIKLLDALCAAKGRCVARARLHSVIRIENSDNDQMVSVYVSQARRVVPAGITNVFGEGYCATPALLELWAGYRAEYARVRS